jgi:hypothetical protein
LGRPKTFSPMRRSSLYLALVRFVTSVLQFALHLARDRTAEPKVRRDHRFTGHAGSIAKAGA